MAANLELMFPLKGLDKNWSNAAQPPLTSPDLLNVRPQDVSEKRARGGQRPGLVKWSDDRIGGAEQPVLAMATIATAVLT